MVKINRKSEVEILQVQRKELEAVIQTSFELHDYLYVLVYNFNKLRREHCQSIFGLKNQIRNVSKKARKERMCANKSASGYGKKEFHLEQANRFESECIELNKQLKSPNERFEQAEVMMNNVVRELNWYYNEARALSQQIQCDYNEVAESVARSYTNIHKSMI